MRILYFSYVVSSFGAIVRSLEIARGASEQGHEVELHYLHPAFRPPPFCYDLMRAWETERFRVFHPPRPQGPPAAAPARRAPEAGKVVEARPRARGLYKQMLQSLRYVPVERALVRRFRPDAIVARPDQVMSFLATSRLERVPLVLESDGPVEELDAHWGISSRWVRPLDTWRARRAQAILYISGTCGDLWRRKGIPAERLFSCPNGADPGVFRPLDPRERSARRAALGLEGSTVIGFSGNLRAWHGVDGLLAAAVPMLEADPGLRLLFVGAVDDPDALASRAVPERIVRERMIFTGLLEYGQMPANIDLADLMVLPYPKSDFFYFSPMKLLEAMSVGKLLVAPRQGQIRDFLEGLESPFLYDPDESGALRGALEGAVRAARAGETGRDAREAVERGHTWRHRGKAAADACAFAAGSAR